MKSSGFFNRSNKEDKSISSNEIAGLLGRSCCNKQEVEVI
jgi:hypothetical protein